MSSLAIADEDPLVIDWNAPSGCASAADVRGEVARLRGGDSHGEKPFRARVDVAFGDGTWHATIRRRREGDLDALRTIDADSCSALAKAVGLIVCVATRRNATDETARAPESAAAATPEAAPAIPDAAPAIPDAAPAIPDAVPAAPIASPIVSAAPRESSEPPRSAVLAPTGRAWRIFLSPRVGFDVGSLPNAGLGLGGQAGVLVASQRLSVGFTAWSPRGVSLGGQGGGRFSLLAGSVEDCFRLSRGASSLDLCGGMELGHVQADGSGVRHPASASSLWLAPEAGLAGALKFSEGFRVRGALGAAAPLVRNTFRFRDIAGDLYTTSWLAMRSSVEVEIDF